MGFVERYPPNTFSWLDLGTTDVDGAKRFYGGLLGWAFEDFPAGEDETYTVARLQGLDAAGLHEHAPEEGIGWTSYVAVDSVDDAVARVTERGGELVGGPADILGVARFAVIRDPAGAHVTLWQADGHNGARLVNEIGTWCWNELVAGDLDAAEAFYTRVFGWTAQRIPAPIPRLSFTMGDLLIGGAHAPAPGESPDPRWDVSFRVADADAAAARVAELGGRVLLPPMDIPIGRFTVVADPTDAPFTLTAFAGPVRGVDGS